METLGDVSRRADRWRPLVIPVRRMESMDLYAGTFSPVGFISESTIKTVALVLGIVAVINSVPGLDPLKRYLNDPEGMFEE